MSAGRIEIRGATLVDPLSGREWTGVLCIEDGRLLSVGEPVAGFRPDRIIEAHGLVACPGLLDLCARLREPGYEYKAHLESEMSAAVAGGVTTLVCPPDTDPPLDEPGLVEMLKYRARGLSQANVYPLGALTRGLQGQRLTEMAELTEAGCVAFGQADAPLQDAQVLLRAMQYAATFDYGVWLRPQDASLARGGVAHDGEVATRLGLAGIPVAAETVALSTILLLARDTGARVHLCRLSSAAGVDLVRQARASGLRVTCDVAAAHVHLSEMDLGYFDANCHLIPPLRSGRDRAALRAGLADGTIDAVCSDHTPVDDDAKQLPFAEAEPGATGLELLLPLILQWAREEGLPFALALRRVTTEPARIMGLPAPALAPGAPADLCLFDPLAAWQVQPGALRSQGKNTPFLGWELVGQVRYTLVAGEVVYASAPG